MECRGAHTRACTGAGARAAVRGARATVSRAALGACSTGEEGRREREGRKEEKEKKKKRENGKRAKEKEKEKKRERERERKRAHTGGIRGGHCGLVGHARCDVRSDDARGARRKRETGQRSESGVGSGKDFWKD